MKTSIYIKAEKVTLLNKKKIKLQDILEIYSTDKDIVDELNKQIIINVEDSKKEHKYVMAIFDIIKMIAKKYPSIDLDIVNLGETDFIINYVPDKDNSSAFGTQTSVASKQPSKTSMKEYVKAAFVILTVFFGSAFAIMAFNYDGNVKELFNLIYKLFMGEERTGGKIVEIAYSIGIPLGTIIFFNHFSKVKIDDDPTPLQIQMRMYEENAYKTIIENSNREKKGN